MKKTLYIQIDNNSLPEGCGEDVEVLDCRCINDFCSMVGDALISDLKDENGKPFYRLLSPVGRLLMDFKDVDKNKFNTIVEGWYDFLGNLLRKGKQIDSFTITFPKKYIDWLTQNEDSHYETVGLTLQKNNGVMSFSSEDVADDIVASLLYKIARAIEEKKDDITFVVFGNPIIRNGSFVIRELKNEGIKCLPYDSWKIAASLSKTPAPPSAVMSNGSEEVFTANGVSFKMIKVVGGSFLMGATTEQLYGPGESDEWASPVHLVKLSDFFISKTLVTRQLWKAVMGKLPILTSTYNRFRENNNNNLPVASVEWNICQEFIFKLNTITGKKFRLPTEAEWEYAARGGKLSKGFKYAGSNNIDDVAWYGEGLWVIHPVALKKPNELGIYDMSGNVEEFCQDWLDYYSSSDTINPKGPSSKRQAGHVIRGGSASSHAYDCRISARHAPWSRVERESAGIRLVMDTDETNIA